MEGLKILLLEDSPMDASIVERHLLKKKMNFTTQRVDEKDEYIVALKKFKPDVILSDHSITDFNSMAAHGIAKKLRPHVPFIVVTGNTTDEFAMQCLSKGVDDLVTKNDLGRLPLAIKSSLDKKRLQSELQEIKELKEEVKRLNWEKDKFLSMISHEMINHVACMRSGLNLLETHTSKKQWEYISQLSQSTNKVHKMLDDYMTIARVQRGVMKPVVTLVPFGMVAEDVVERNKDFAAQKNITVNFVNECGDTSFRTDMSYVAIITENLLSNAIKYSHPGKQVCVKAYKENGSYKIQVSDEGRGIPKKEIPKLYKRFEKLSPRPTAGEPSHGLGLSIVKDLVDSLGATIHCKSAINKGTTFTITF